MEPAAVRSQYRTGDLRGYFPAVSESLFRVIPKGLPLQHKAREEPDLLRVNEIAAISVGEADTR